MPPFLLELCIRATYPRYMGKSWDTMVASGEDVGFCYAAVLSLADFFRDDAYWCSTSVRYTVYAELLTLRLIPSKIQDPIL